jgi:hypothetical protein
MIQLSFTSDWHQPVAIWFDLLHDEKPDEYYQFYGYQYLTEEEAEQMLSDPFVSKSVKTALADALT